MDSPPSSTSRRLRWALLIALALHLALLWRYAPDLFARLEAARKTDAAQPAEVEQEEVIEILAPPAPPKGQGMTLATTLSKGSPERLSPTLPEGFFDKPAPVAAGQLSLADDLEFARASGARFVANIIPAAMRLLNINAVSDQARTPPPKPAEKPAEKPAPRAAPVPAIPTPVSVAEQEPEPEPELEPLPDPSAPLPFLLPELAEDTNVDAAIAQASRSAERSAREAYTPRPPRPAADYRALLPQGPMVAAPPLPLGGAVREAESQESRESGITTFALDAPAARDAVRAAPDAGKSAAVARQQFFSLLTARLKATNQRLLAEAVRAGPRTTVRMKFLVDRSGRVLEISPAETVPRDLAERAVAVIRAATLPRVPDTMTQVPLELSFPVEVYR